MLRFTDVLRPKDLKKGITQNPLCFLSIWPNHKEEEQEPVLVDSQYRVNDTGNFSSDARAQRDEKRPRNLCKGQCSGDWCLQPHCK